MSTTSSTSTTGRPIRSDPIHSLYYGAQFLDRVNGPEDRDGVPSEDWPPRVVPGNEGLSGDPPSDATVLWDGDEATLDRWEHTDESEPEWVEHEEYFAVNLGSGNIRTKESFGDCHLHLEWRSPEEYDGYVDIEEGATARHRGTAVSS